MRLGADSDPNGRVTDFRDNARTGDKAGGHIVEVQDRGGMGSQMECVGVVASGGQPNLTIDRIVLEMWPLLSGSRNPATGQS